MAQSYHPLAIANEFIVRSGGEGAQHMKLQKLVYCAHGWSLSGSPVSIVNEKPEVWRHGPVFPSLYRILAGFGSEYIKHTRAIIPAGAHPRVDHGDQFACEVIDYVWGRYGHKTSWELSDMTHKKGTPWQIVAEQHSYRLPRHTTIDDSLVETEFTRIRESEIAKTG